MTKLEQAARQALEALEAVSTAKERGFGIEYAKGYVDPVITALREALAEQAEQEPAGHLCEASFGRGQVFWFNKPADNTPLYASPVRTKDLTDDEIADVIGWALDEFYLADFRAVIAADREKNK